MNTIKSSFGSSRKRRHEKALKDEETQIKLWLQEMIPLRNEVGTESMMKQMRMKIQEQVKQQPQRKQQILQAWAHVERIYKESTSR